MRTVKILLITLLTANFAMAADLEGAAKQRAKDFSDIIVKLKTMSGSFDEKLKRNEEVFENFFAVDAIANLVSGPIPKTAQCKEIEDKAKSSGADKKAIKLALKEAGCKQQYEVDMVSVELKSEFLKTYRTFVAGFFMSSLGKADEVRFGETAKQDSDIDVTTTGSVVAEGVTYGGVKTPYRLSTEGVLKMLDIRTEGISYIAGSHRENIGGSVKRAAKALNIAADDYTSRVKVGIMYMNCMLENNFKVSYAGSSATVKILEADECADKVVSDLKK